MLENLAPDFECEIDTLLPAYQQNFITRNISLIEYVDFTESYVESKESLLEIQRKLLIQLEEIQYVTGKEFDY